MKTNKTKKVLIALDYDPTAQKVAETGFSLARSLEAEVILLHVISDPVYYSTSEFSPIMGFAGFKSMDNLLIESTEGLIKASQHFLNKVKHHLGDENIQTLIKEGEFAEAIISAAKSLHVEFIVMGSHSRKWLENILLGSVTEKVLRQTFIPLFIVPTKKVN
jgi:nucleotide-binding universal stress UspA family protein